MSGIRLDIPIRAIEVQTLAEAEHAVEIGYIGEIPARKIEFRELTVTIESAVHTLNLGCVHHGDIKLL